MAVGAEVTLCCNCILHLSVILLLCNAHCIQGVIGANMLDFKSRSAHPNCTSVYCVDRVPSITLLSVHTILICTIPKFTLDSPNDCSIRVFVTEFEKTRLPHTHNIKLTISSEMDCWLNTLSYSTVCLAPKSQVWFLWQLFLDPV